jgi:hypothetical protein
MPDLPPTVSNNKMCLPAEKGHLVCDDTPQRLHGYLNRVSGGMLRYVKLKFKTVYIKLKTAAIIFLKLHEFKFCVLVCRV